MNGDYEVTNCSAVLNRGFCGERLEWLHYCEIDKLEKVRN